VSHFSRRLGQKDKHSELHRLTVLVDGGQVYTAFLDARSTIRMAGGGPAGKQRVFDRNEDACDLQFMCCPYFKVWYSFLNAAACERWRRC
jgi:hypothetical protein